MGNTVLLLVWIREKKIPNDTIHNLDVSNYLFRPVLKGQMSDTFDDMKREKGFVI